MNRWENLGRIFRPRRLHEKLQTHAANPTALLLTNEKVRIYFNSRSADQRSSIGWVVFNLNKLKAGPLEICKKPVLEPGKPGLFDDSGVSVSCLIWQGDVLFLYYVGWNLGKTVPWRNSIGLAISHDGGLNFKKYSDAPILDRSEIDPYSLSYPWILKYKSKKMLMYYGSNLSWGEQGKKDQIIHTIKIATSSNGIQWTPLKKIIFKFQNKYEVALARPCVIKDNGIYKMWFSSKKKFYKIEYAESKNGFSWYKKSATKSIGKTRENWASKSVEYPCVFKALGKKWMLYNGNNYGKSGFGIAVNDTR